MTLITESPSNYQNLSDMSVKELVTAINREDQTVATAVEKEIESIVRLIENIFPKIKGGGRLFYIGAGTSGRLGILDASDYPPLYEIPEDLITGIIAGGEIAIRKKVENAENNQTQAWEDLKSYQIDQNDCIIGISASGTSPYVVAGLREARKNGILTGCITNNRSMPVSTEADFAVEVVVGPEFITGSTKMKAGTAQKMILNIISTTLTIRMAGAEENEKGETKPLNSKLVNRAVKMVMNKTHLDYEGAFKWLQEYGNVRQTIEAYWQAQQDID